MQPKSVRNFVLVALKATNFENGLVVLEKVNVLKHTAADLRK